VLQGAVCANPCPPGSYHKDCKRRCDCYNGAVCDHVNGKCHCLPGYQGTKVTNRLFGMKSNLETTVADPDPYALGLLDSDPDPSIKKQR
jgi:hypothetical protein